MKRRNPENKETYKNCQNIFEMIKWKSMEKIYYEKLIKFQGDTKIMEEIVGTDKLSFPQKIVIDKNQIVGETKITNEFNYFFTNISPK